MTFNTKQIPGITPRQWERLRELLDDDRFMVLEGPWLRSATGMRSDHAFSLMAALARFGFGKMEWQVFHECAEHTVEVVSEQVIKLPWTCPECEEEVTDGDELRMEPRLRLTKRVVFV